MTKKSLDMTNKLIKLEDISTSDNNLIRQLSDNLQDVTPEDVDGMCEKVDEAEKQREEKKKKEEEYAENLKGITSAILNDLRENHVKVEENAEMFGYKGKIVHIELPAVGNFRGFKFNYFDSDDGMLPDDFERNSKLEKYSYSIKEIAELLKAMNEYMKACGVSMDVGMDFENDLKGRETKIYGCDTGRALKEIMGLIGVKNRRELREYRMKDKKIEKGYRISDKKIEIDKIVRLKWLCIGDDYCRFKFMSDHLDHHAHLFLKLSV